METPPVTKTISIDMQLSVSLTQYFEVPLDYVIKGSYPYEAYQNLIDDFKGQNVNAIQEPEELALYDDFDIDIEFESMEDTFYIYNNLTDEVEVKCFNSEKRK